MFDIHSPVRRTLVTVVIAACVSASCLSVGVLGALGANGSAPASARPARSSGGALASASGSRFTACPSPVQARNEPLAVVVGASITAGYGATSPTDAWPYLLARQMGWRLAVRGVPGAGYVHTGMGGGGPLIRELVGLHVLGCHPSVVVLQAGHNDANEPTAALQSAVAATVGLVKSKAPGARLVLLTVFPGGHATVAELRTDHTIITMARQTDAHVVVIDPIAQRWHYATIRDHLHPTNRGYRWIARRMATDLTINGTVPKASCVRRVAPHRTAGTTKTDVSPN